MKSKFISIFILLLFSLILVKGVEGACINASQTSQNNLSSGITNICPQTYNMSASISFCTKGSNILLNISGSKFIGKGATKFVMDCDYNYNNNFTLDGFGSGLVTNYSDRFIELYSNDHTIRNTLFGNSSNSQIIYSGDDNNANWKIYNNVFLGTIYASDVMSLKGTNFNISNNTKNNYAIPTTDVFFISLLTKNSLAYNNNINGFNGYSIAGNNNSIYNSLIVNLTDSNSFAGCLYISGDNNSFYNNSCINGNLNLDIAGKNNIITNNTLINNTLLSSITLGITSNSNIINKNIINITDIGVTSIGNNNIVSNNIMDNLNTLYDAWGLGMYLQNDNGSYIVNNTILRAYSSGIYMSNSSNIIFNNNSIYLLNLTEKNSLGRGEDQGEAMCSIMVSEIFKNYYGGLDPNVNDNQTILYKYHSSNITLMDNTFLNNPQCYLNTQDVVNLTHNLGTNWYRSISIPYYINNISFYSNNNFDYLSQYYGGYKQDLHIALSYWAYCGNVPATPCNATNNISNSKFNYTISKTNINLTNNVNFNLMGGVYSALSYSPYNDIKNTSNGVILSSNVDNYSLTLSPNQRIEVGSFTGIDCSLPVNLILANVGKPCTIFPVRNKQYVCNFASCNAI